MSLNWREIDAVLTELSLQDSHVQKIRQPDFTSLILDLYKPRDRFPLYIQLGQNQTRLHRISMPVAATVKLQRFAQLLRSKIGGGRIIGAEQIGEDRIIKLTVRRASVDLLLLIRLWNNAANIILTETDGTIIDAFFRRPRRGEISGGLFVPSVAAKAATNGREKREYRIRDFPGEGDINQRIEQFYLSQVIEGETERLKKAIERFLGQEESKALAAIEKVREGPVSQGQTDRYKMIGDIIMSNLHRIQKGSRWIDADNYYENNNTISIELDPELPPEGNAQAYYQKARKGRRRSELLHDEIENHGHVLQEIKKKRSAVETADINALRTMHEQLVAKQRQSKSTSVAIGIPGLQFESGPFTILVGRTARENDTLLRHHVRGNDYWLHSRDYPGSYVFIRSMKGKSVPLDVLLDAGSLALHYSRGRSGTHGDLFYTQVKYLRRVKDGKTGLVIPTQEKNLSVRIDDERLKRLLGR